MLGLWLILLFVVGWFALACVWCCLLFVCVLRALGVVVVFFLVCCLCCWLGVLCRWVSVNSVVHLSLNFILCFVVVVVCSVYSLLHDSGSLGFGAGCWLVIEFVI